MASASLAKAQITVLYGAFGKTKGINLSKLDFVVMSHGRTRL
jgi:hypothetical protein